MTSIGQLYDAIAARLAMIPGVDVRKLVPAMEIAKTRPQRPLLAITWLGREVADPPIVGRGWQQSVVRWEVDIVVPSAPTDRAAGESAADDLAQQVVAALCPLDQSWRPAADCGPMEWEATEAIGDIQAGFALAVILSHQQWR